MTNPFKKPEWRPDLAEINEYIVDLKRVMSLRDNSKEGTERARFDYTIHVMQEVLIFLNTMPGQPLAAIPTEPSKA